MPWVKAFHIIFMVTWFAGLFYLPRLFVYHATTEDEPSLARFKVMEHKLFAIMTIGAVLTAFFGLWMLFGYAWEAYAHTSGWLHAKLTLVAGLIGYHIWLWFLMRDFRADANVHSEGFYRFINEIPALLLVAIVILAVVKPF